jgi:regulator of protease activity HflC (stomatin/prohibitin superfamily)
MLALADGYVRNTVREAFNDVASKLPVQDIYGAGKSKMLGDVTQKCRDVLGKDGFVIDQLTINGALRLPQNVADAINRAMEATQNAIQSENRVAAGEGRGRAGDHAGARRRPRRAAGGRGRGRRAPHQRARGGEGQRDHPAVDDPSVLQYRAIEHWDGKLPTYNGGGALPMLTFDAAPPAKPAPPAAKP